MRYIGNKTPILDEIDAVVGDLLPPGGTLLDIFTGTTSVARHFRARGHRVVANDIMHVSHVLAVAHLEGPADGPTFEGLRGAVPALDGAPAGEEAVEAVCAHLTREVPPRTGLVTRAYSPEATPPRKYFTPDVARAIDGVLERLTTWWRDDRVTRWEHHLLLAALVDAADRRANISGTYGAFLKSWQPSARKDLDLRPPERVPGPPGTAHRRDAFELIPEVDCDVLYVDPPYNRRQYPPNYHVLETIARYHDIPDVEAYLDGLYGKTGLHEYPRSAFCSKARGKCRNALRRLLEPARARHVVLSYSEEGILDEEEILEVLAAVGRDEPEVTRIRHRRFRSDSDGPDRTYKVLPGKDPDEVDELLFRARLGERVPTART